MEDKAGRAVHFSVDDICRSTQPQLVRESALDFLSIKGELIQVQKKFKKFYQWSHQ